MGYKSNVAKRARLPMEMEATVFGFMTAAAPSVGEMIYYNVIMSPYDHHVHRPVELHS